MTMIYVTGNVLPVIKKRGEPITLAGDKISAQLKTYRHAMFLGMFVRLNA
jgi:hypothetical protein